MIHQSDEKTAVRHNFGEAKMAQNMKYVNQTESELLTWFIAQVDGLKFKGIEVESLNFSYDKVNGFGISLEQAKPQEKNQEAV